MKGASVVFASAREKKRRLAKVSSDLWQTPESLVERIHQVGPVELDVCTSLRNPVGADRFYTEKDDGLVQSWDVADDAIAYGNWPYSQKGWLERASAPWRGSRLMLGPARTETAAWHDYVWPAASRVCFLRGRLVFEVPPCKRGHDWQPRMVMVKRKLKQKLVCRHCDVEKPTSAPFPSALILYSNTPEIVDRFGVVFRDTGSVVAP